MMRKWQVVGVVRVVNCQPPKSPKGDFNEAQFSRTTGVLKTVSRT